MYIFETRFHKYLKINYTLRTLTLDKGTVMIERDKKLGYFNFFCKANEIYFLPSLPQPSVGQIIGYFGCQSPDPVLESRAQVTSMSHWPQQQLPTKTSLPNKLSYSQSRDPGRVQGCPGVGGMGVEQNDPRSISTVK